MFLVNLPLASLALIGALLLMDSKLFFRERRGVGFDWPGAAMSTAALVTFLMLMTNGYRLGWGSPVIIGALVLQSAGTGLFGSPNSASIFGASQGSRHGVVAALLSLVRNSANVTSIAVATAVVAATMVSMGYAPDLSNVSGGDDPGLRASFVSGMSLLYLAMGCLLIVGVVASFLKGPAPAGTAQADERPIGVQAGD